MSLTCRWASSESSYKSCNGMVLPLLILFSAFSIFPFPCRNFRAFSKGFMLPMLSTFAQYVSAFRGCHHCACQQRLLFVVLHRCLTGVPKQACLIALAQRAPLVSSRVGGAEAFCLPQLSLVTMPSVDPVCMPSDTGFVFHKCLPDICATAGMPLEILASGTPLVKEGLYVQKPQLTQTVPCVKAFSGSCLFAWWLQMFCSAFHRCLPDKCPKASISLEVLG